MTEQIGVNGKIFNYIEGRLADGYSTLVLVGGRRSGKTFAICQKSLMEVYNNGAIINFASMTSEQGRLGAYSDCKTIIESSVGLTSAFEILTSPREIRCRHNKGRIFFNSYSDSETAKGIACDYLFVNEANNFTMQQVTDLMANVRIATFFDFNPNIEFWIEDLVPKEQWCHTTWKDNRKHLTKAQLQYFADLKRLGGSVNSDPVHRRNYLVYYEGKFAEVQGQIFHVGNMHKVREEELPNDLTSFSIFCDPSALRGADFFACVFSAFSPSMDRIYILDEWSTNTGGKYDIAKILQGWCLQRDEVQIYIETNGIIGQEFYEYAMNSELPVQGFTSKGNKYDRIVAQFERITEKMLFVENEHLDSYLNQCYLFEKKCVHDDNIDAVASTAMLQKYLNNMADGLTESR